MDVLSLWDGSMKEITQEKKNHLDEIIKEGNTEYFSWRLISFVRELDIILALVRNDRPWFGILLSCHSTSKPPEEHAANQLTDGCHDGSVTLAR